ncbi:MAG: hypothetical protein SFZ23_01885 [Planctomycetota bacterium]|nr:hypothetical protein [Planctomycetota bacterium]
MSSTLDPRRALGRVPSLLGVPGAIAAVCLTLALVSVGAAIVPVVRAALAPSVAAPSATQEALAKERDKFTAAFDEQLAQVRGRSLFFIPPEPRRAPVRRAAAPPAAPPPPRAATPSTYAGPALIGVAYGAAWFADGLRLAAGESKDDLRVVRVQAPWSVDVQWRGGDFTLDLFKRDSLIHAQPASQPEAKAEDEPQSELPQTPPPNGSSDANKPDSIPETPATEAGASVPTPAAPNPESKAQPSGAER